MSLGLHTEVAPVGADVDTLCPQCVRRCPPLDPFVLMPTVFGLRPKFPDREGDEVLNLGGLRGEMLAGHDPLTVALASAKLGFEFDNPRSRRA